MSGNQSLPDDVLEEIKLAFDEVIKNNFLFVIKKQQQRITSFVTYVG